MARQQADPRAYCHARGWTLWEGSGYADSGVSAYGGANLAEGALGRFVEDLKANRFGPDPIALLLEDLDRFSRQFPLAVLPILIDDLLNAGVTISVMAKARDISRASIKANPMELHELLFWLSASHDFSEKLSHRISHVHQNKRDRIRNGEAVTPDAAPAWISLVDGQWVLNDFAKVIRRLLDLAADHGHAVVASTLNKEGAPSPGQWRHNRLGAKAKPQARPLLWNSASVQRVLNSPAIVGHRQVMAPGYRSVIRAWKEDCAIKLRQGAKQADLPSCPARQHEEPQLNYYPPLLTEQEHAAVLAAAGRRRPVNGGRTEKLNWLAQGFTFCSQCGDLYGMAANQRKTAEGKTVSTYYLSCKGRRKGSGCNAPSIKLHDAQASLLTRLAAADFVEMLGAHGRASNGSPLAQALADKAESQGKVDQFSAALAVGEKAMAAESDSDVLRVLAKRQAQQEAELAKAKQAFAAAMAELQRLQSGAPLPALGEAASAEVAALMATFARREDTVEDRRLVRSHLLRMGLIVHLNGDDAQLGLQVGSTSQINWRPLARVARRTALAEGIVNPASAWDQPGIGAGVVTRDGELLVVPLPGDSPADPDAAGYAQGLEDGQRLLGLASEEEL